MEQLEDFYEGAMPPEKKKWPRVKMIVGIFMFIIALVVLVFIPGKIFAVAQGSLALVIRSWDEALGLNNRGEIIEADIATDTRQIGYPNASDTSSSSWSGISHFRDNDSNGTQVRVPRKDKEVFNSSEVSDKSSGVSDSISSLSSSVLDEVLAPSSSGASILLGQESSTLQLKNKISECSFSSLPSSTPRIIFNEIAWMGSVIQPGETPARASNREWIEIKNISQNDISLSRWQILDSAGNVKIVFGPGDRLGAGSLFTLSRDGEMVGGVSADKAYSGSLPNGGDELALFDPDCGVSDLLDASKGWPGGDNATKQTLERKADAIGWQTSLLAGGTPRAENSLGAPSSASTSMEKYQVSVAIEGDGPGKVIAKPAGIDCPRVCSFEYASGTELTLTATPGANAIFIGWSGACSGKSDCSFVTGGMSSVTAEFRSAGDMVVISDTSSVVASPDENQSASSSILDQVIPINTSTSSVSVVPVLPPAGHLLIVSIQIAGPSSTNDFVKFYNPTAVAIDISGWKLHKKSSTGADYSLRDFPQGTVIASDSYFIWANSSGGFAQSIGADASSTETISADNSVAVIDSAGNVVDAVAWGAGANQYVEGAPYPADPKANDVLIRIVSNGVMVDTKNNAADFVLQ